MKDTETELKDATLFWLGTRDALDLTIATLCQSHYHVLTAVQDALHERYEAA